MNHTTKEIIPIVFATDDGYAPYLGVAIASLIAHHSHEKDYKVYVLYTTLTPEHRRRLCNLSTGTVTVECVDITENTTELFGYEDDTYLSVEMTYRLLIPEVFPQYDKMLYLDCDIIILDDVSKLFRTDLKENVLGVAQVIMNRSLQNHNERAQIPQEAAFNSGVLLLNCKAFQKENIKERALSLLKEDWKRSEKLYTYPDQDILNLLCEHKTTQFPMNWNLEWWCDFDLRESTTLTPEARASYDIAKTDPKIVHFTSSEKAWERPDYPFADLFWSYARTTVFYEEILMNVTLRKKQKFNNFPWKKVKAGSVIVIYGAGAVGKSYLEQMSMTNYCHVAAICDQNAKNIKDVLLPVVTPEELRSLVFDHIVVAVLSLEVKERIAEHLTKLGIAPDKIL